MKRVLYYGALFLAFVGCTRVSESEIPEGTIVFKAYSADNAVTKTVLQEDGSVLWCPTEDISVFYGSEGPWRFTSQNKENAAVVDFIGSLEGIQYNDSDRFFAAYPYSEKNTCDGQRLVVELPEMQQAVPGTFDNGLFLTVAKSENRTLYFYNVCGGIKFSVTEPDIQKVTFKGNAGETLAGTATVSFGIDGKPAVDQVEDGKKELTLNAPDGETFQVGKWYYIVSLPTVLSEGYTMSFHKVDGTVAVKPGTRTVTIKRAFWGQLEGADASLSYDIPDNEIWYTSSDGKMVEPDWGKYSYSGIPRLVSNTYVEGKGVMVFDGPVTQLPPFSFHSLNSLETLSFPKSLQSLATGEFWGCSQLKNVVVPGEIVRCSGNPFVGCSDLESIAGPNMLADGVSFVVDGTLVSTLHSSLSSYRVPGSVQSLGESVFSDWNGKTIMIPEEIVTEMEPFEFWYGRHPQGNRIVLEGRRAYLDVFRLWLRLHWDENVIEVGSMEAREEGLSELYNMMGEIESLCRKMAEDESFQQYAPEDIQGILDYLLGANRFQEELLNDPEGFYEYFSRDFYEWLEEFDIYYGVTSLELDKTSLSLLTETLGELTATATYAYEVAGEMEWESDNPDVAWVLDGVVAAAGPGDAVITVSMGQKSASCHVHVSDPVYNGPEIIDLGLSVKWRAMNLGARWPSGRGGLYAWGETEAKTDFSLASYKWFANGDPQQILKYNSDEGRGVVDGLSTLEPEDDAAHVNLGDGWRIPTREEYQELIDNCDWSMVTMNGIYCFQVRSRKNGNEIFIPANDSRQPSVFKWYGQYRDEGEYWTSSGGSISCASCLYFKSTYSSAEIYPNYRNLGKGIRPVKD